MWRSILLSQMLIPLSGFASGFSELQSEFQSSEDIEISQEQVFTYAEHARIRHRLPYTVVPQQRGNTVFFEMNSGKDICRQSVILSFKEVLVHTKCFRENSHVLIDSVLSFPKAP